MSELAAEQTLFVRHAKRDGRSVARLRAVERGGACIVEAEVFPLGAAQPVYPGPYRFDDATKATVFVNEAVESLLYLGCEIFGS